MYENSFDREDRITVHESFVTWQGEYYETADEHLLRKRKEELTDLVKKVIKKELSSTDKLITELHWYEQKNFKEIGEELDMDPSTVSRRMNKINDIIFEKLKYAIDYRFGSSFVPKAKLIIKNRQAAYAYHNPKTVSERIVNLRTKQYLTLEDVSEMTGISLRQLNIIEASAESMTVSQLQKLALCFHTTADYIISGKNHN